MPDFIPLPVTDDMPLKQQKYRVRRNCWMRGHPKATPEETAANLQRIARECQYQPSEE